MKKMDTRVSILLRVRIAFLFVFLFALVIAFRVVEIQYIEGAYWKQQAREIALKEITVKAVRGNIYADDGSLLATSLPFYRVAFDPTVASEEVYKKGIDSLCLKLSAFFDNKSYLDYRNRIDYARKHGQQYIVLSSRKIAHGRKKEMMEWPIFREGRMKGGIIFEKIPQRFKPFGFLSERTVGFVNENGRGAGLEYSFNSTLAGRDGKGLYQKMAGNNWKPVYDGSEVKPEKGLDIETTININLQDVTQAALLKALLEHDADHGSAVVMEVHTGEIKAMCNLSKLQDGRYGEIFNYAVGGLTEPGSTFKLASVIALLEDTNLSLQDTVDTGTGRYYFYDRAMTDHKPGGYGMLTLEEAFYKSSNIGISKLVNKHFGLKPQKYVDYLYDMGLASPVGFQLAGEKNPMIKKPDDPTWSGITLPWMSIGYELALTPLQTLTFYNAIANDGKMVQPLIVKRTKKADKMIEAYQPAVLNRKICSTETLAKVKMLLEDVVENGTATNIRNDHYKIAGKTGTAKKLKEGRYTNTYYTSFVGYFPANRPKYSCIVVIDNPKGYNQYGSDVAAPVFRTVADKIYSQDPQMHRTLPANPLAADGVFPLIQAGYYQDLKQVCDAMGVTSVEVEGEDWVRTQIDHNTIQWVGNRVEGQNVANHVPDVRGMTLRDALYLLENRGLVVIYKGVGRVKEQSQIPGARIQRGNRIYLELS